MRTIDIPGRPALELAHLLLDVNGTLTNRGQLIADVEPRLRRLQRTFDVHLLSADTFGSLARSPPRWVPTRGSSGTVAEKAAAVRELGARRCAAIGNGANDSGMLREAALGIAVIGPEGAAAGTIAAADIVCHSIGDALELLLDDRALVATLRP